MRIVSLLFVLLRIYLVELCWPGLFAKALASVNIRSLICIAGAGGPVPSATAAPAEEKKVEAKKEESKGGLMMTWALVFLTKGL